MPKPLDQWVQSLGSKPFPILNTTRRRIMAMVKRPATSNADLARIASCDLGLSLQLLQRVNAQLPAEREAIGDLVHALSMLGIGPLMEAVSSLPPLEDLYQGQTLQTLKHLYSRSVHAANYARFLGEHLYMERQNELEAAALLQDIGQIALCCQHQDQMHQVRAMTSGGASPGAAGNAVFGFDFPELSKSLIVHWRLPALAEQALSSCNSHLPRPLVVMLGREIARTSDSGWNSEATAELLELTADYLRTKPAVLSADIHSLCAAIGRKLLGYRLPVAAFQLIALPRPALYPQVVLQRATDRSDARRTLAGMVYLPLQESATPQMAGQRLARRGALKDDLWVKGRPEPAIRNDQPSAVSTRDARTIQREQTQTPLQPRVPTGASPAAIKTRVPPQPRHNQHAANPMQECLSLAMRGMRETSAIRRALFAILSSDRKQLKARFIADDAADSALRNFTLDLEQRNLFSALMSKSQSFWLNSDNHEKYLPLIPAAARTTLSNEGFFIMSLFIRNRPIGLIYADADGGESLDTDSYQQFKALCQQAVEEISRRLPVKAQSTG